MTTDTNRNEIELGTEELELVSGGWFAFQMITAAASSLKDVKGASRQFSELPAGWESGMTTAPVEPKL